MTNWSHFFGAYLETSHHDGSTWREWSTQLMVRKQKREIRRDKHSIAPSKICPQWSKDFPLDCTSCSFYNLPILPSWRPSLKHVGLWGPSTFQHVPFRCWETPHPNSLFHLLFLKISLYYKTRYNLNTHHLFLLLLAPSTDSTTTNNNKYVHCT